MSVYFAFLFSCFLIYIAVYFYVLCVSYCYVACSYHVLLFLLLCIRSICTSDCGYFIACVALLLLSCCSWLLFIVLIVVSC